MQQYVATFHTHLSAMRSQRALSQAGISVRLAPVPRSISSSCGTCVKYCADTPGTELMDADLEAIYLEAGGQYSQCCY